MRTLSLFATGCVALIFSACSGLPADHPVSKRDGYTAVVSTAEAERRILVTFTDRSIGRVALGDPGLSYRQRGGRYQTSTYSRELANALSRDYGLTMITDWPVTTVGVHCVVFEVDRSRSLQEVITALGKDTRVGGVQPMQRFRVLNDPYSRFQPALESMQILDAHRWSTGAGVTVAVIDTGVDGGHPDLDGQVIANEDMVGAGGVAAAAHDIHGTAVAGLIAALANNNEGIVGVAPGAKLLAYRACWQESENNPAATCDSFTLAKALNNAIARKPQIINLSLTGPEDPLLSILIKKALEERIIVVAAAPDQKGASAGFPASVPGVIAVQALGNAGPGSASVATTDAGFFAPGNKVFTTFPQRGYNFISGNSFAAAHVSGVVALMLSLKPELTLAEVAQALKQGATDENVQGIKHVTNCVNACTAVLQIHTGGDCHKHATKT
jgi:hypothetical protein